MNDDFKNPLALTNDAEAPTLGMSSVYRLFEAFIGLREKNERQHKLFEQTLNRARDSLQSSFNTFAAETQKAYQQMRQEMVGEKKFSLSLLNELLDLAIELDHIVAAKPALAGAGPEGDAVERWMSAIEIQNRKVQDALRKFGIHPYDAAVGTPYNPALHERVGVKRLEGMDALRVAEQVQRGYASQQPEFMLRRPKVLVTE
ncbi:MAG: nucleotide exchange factor GrpE [Gemmataceae bacterium]|nr:nucleotide exchange factor GrpE [Gemmataceae bacterium]